MAFIENFSAIFGANEKILAADKAVMAKIAPKLAEIEDVMQLNQLKMLNAFKECRVAAHHLAGSTGYGYDDAGRQKLEQVFAMLTNSEAALFRHNFMSGTHAISVALFGLLRPGDTVLCATGRPYDTLAKAIGLSGGGAYGTLLEFGIKYNEIALQNNRLNLQEIEKQACNAKVLYIQRSRGYASRRALSPLEIGEAAKAAKAANPDIWVMVDNCYGEFTQSSEPTAHGADLIVGSLIKNPGGGIAPTGGYIAGKQQLVELCAHRLSAPGVGDEVGCTMDVLRQLYLGLYFAPQVTAAALKVAVYASALFEHLGFAVEPLWNEERNDIITAIHTKQPEKLRALCRAVQAMSPVDSFAVPEPCPMPGYTSEVIMAAGAFTLGSSIELSCDGPMKEPYTAYLQGSLNFAAGRAAVLFAADEMLNLK